MSHHVGNQAHVKGHLLALSHLHSTPDCLQGALKACAEQEAGKQGCMLDACMQRTPCQSCGHGGSCDNMLHVYQSSCDDPAG